MKALRGWKRMVVLLGAVMLVAGMQAVASADGTEALGPPSIPIADGSGIVSAGVGMGDGPATININVPGTVVQALLYWQGMAAGPVFDNSVNVNGTPVVGTLIGGPAQFISANNYVSTLRADITSMVSSGANALNISGMDFNRENDGAGVVVIYDDGTEADLGIFDGTDTAFFRYDPPQDTTAPVTFNFAPEPVDRTAAMSLFVGSVAIDPGNPPPRPTIIRVESGGVTTDFNDLLGGHDGNQWDTATISVNVPAGASSVTIRVLSADGTGSGYLPASLVWNTATLAVGVTPPPPPPPPGGEGCTPGYWKQPHHFGDWVGYAPGDSFSAIFGVPYNKTLLEALSAGGGGNIALGRHAVAALLNAASGDVDSSYTTADVIAMVQAAYASGNFEKTKNVLEKDNESGCPL